MFSIFIIAKFAKSNRSLSIFFIFQQTLSIIIKNIFYISCAFINFVFAIFITIKFFKYLNCFFEFTILHKGNSFIVFTVKYCCFYGSFTINNFIIAIFIAVESFKSSNSFAIFTFIHKRNGIFVFSIRYYNVIKQTGNNNYYTNNRSNNSSQFLNSFNVFLCFDFGNFSLAFTFYAICFFFRFNLCNYSITFNNTLVCIFPPWNSVKNFNCIIII